ncbi:centromere-associated protein E isoform X1 [Drosophila suzukii]|uniref:Centromere-associated protein E isoform X1 n=1 Tax=Drosophila suzukii TaxID=28584 RepID=A0AB39ZGT3_DROSZ
MAKTMNLPDNLQSRVFALGPAPPGFRPPKATAFATAESNLRRATTYLKDTNNRLEYLRVRLQRETNQARRMSYKEKTMSFAKEQIRAKALITKYRLKLVHLQDAEIFKVTKHLKQMEDLLADVNNRLANLRSKIVKESDAKVRQVDVTNSFHLVREQHKTKVLCERWQDRLDQLKKARIVRSDQLLQKPTSFQKPQALTRLPEKPKTEHQKLQEALVLEASKAKGAKNNANETGCKRCAFLSKMNKQGQPRLCRVCKKWADDKGKAKETVTKKTESNDLEVRVCMDSSSTESTIKIEIEPVELKEIEEMRSLENETISNSKVNKPPQLLKPVEQLPGKPGELNINGKRLRAVQVNKPTHLLSLNEQSPGQPENQNLSGNRLQTPGQWSVTISKAKVNKPPEKLRRVEKPGQPEESPSAKRIRTAQAQRETENGKANGPRLVRVEQQPGQPEGQNPSIKRTAQGPPQPISNKKLNKPPQLLSRVKQVLRQPKEQNQNGKRLQTSHVTRETISNDKVNKPAQLFPVIVAVKSEAVSSIEEDQVTSKDSIDPNIITSIQDTLKSIDSKNMALAHLQILQEYAMLNDNFRAIGLLTEVEKSIIHPPQKEDFDL